MKATFESTVDVLVKAYLNDTLEHGSCEACAVGNIVHAAGFKRYGNLAFKDMPKDSCGNWKALFVTYSDGVQRIRKRDTEKYWNYDPEWVSIGEKMVASTGYTDDELAQVEFAFETADKGKNDDEWMFNGLMSVVDVLAKIHSVSLEQKSAAKAMFVKENL